MDRNMGKRIIVADDIESIRMAIADYLRPDYDVMEASNGKEAMQILREQPVDLVITDIRMPVMGGLELIHYIKGNHPEVQYALMTAYNVDDYIEFASREKIWNIIPKTSFLDLRFIGVMVRKLLGDWLFGLEPYFPGVQTVELGVDPGKKDILSLENTEGTFYRCSFTADREISQKWDHIGQWFIDQGAPSVIRMILDELASNACVRAVDEAGLQESDDHPPVEIGFGFLDNNSVLSVVDRLGSLDRNEILLRLQRQIITDNKTGLPLGIADTHGRGLFISRENLDHLIFNIAPGFRTEVIGIVNLDGLSRTRALSIFQKKPDS